VGKFCQQQDMNLSPQSLGAAIRQTRETRQLARNDLAAKAGIGKTALFDLEHGNPGVRLSTLMAVMDVLDMELELKNSSLPETLEEALEKTFEDSNSPSPSTPDDLPDHLL
jgi:transcriptional regulator with XRE-family HTH domain